MTQTLNKYNTFKMDFVLYIYGKFKIDYIQMSMTVQHDRIEV